MARDPVCGMIIDADAAAGKSEYNGVTYYFCAPGCKKAFDRDPKKHVERQETGHARPRE